MVAVTAPVLTPVPLVTVPRPWSRLPVPPVKVAVRVLEPPLVTAVGEALKAVMTGGATTVTVAVAEIVGDAALVAIT